MAIRTIAGVNRRLDEVASDLARLRDEIDEIPYEEAHTRLLLNQVKLTEVDAAIEVIYSEDDGSEAVAS